MIRDQHHRLELKERRVHAAASSSREGTGLSSVNPNDLAGVFGGLPCGMPPREPIRVLLQVEWGWIRPLPTILQLGGWNIDDVVSNRRVAAQVRHLWKLRRASQSVKTGRERRNEIEEVRWYRNQGCPVPCPMCGSLDTCGCP